MPKKMLKARDIERLENTSFAAALVGDIDLSDTRKIIIIADTHDCTNETRCSASCAGECSCGCESNICCVTFECTEYTQEHHCTGAGLAPPAPPP